MGHACSKLKVATTTTIDFGYTSPRGIYSSDVEYDLNIVKQLIRKGRLAPFYEGTTQHTKLNKKRLILYRIK